MYTAIVCKITTGPHPNADRLQIAFAGGYQCIVSLDYKDGDVVIVFPEGGQLAHNFCMANNLYRKNPEKEGELMGGYMEENRRVKALKLRKAESNALCLPIQSISDWLCYVHMKEGKGVRTGVPIFEVGDEITDAKGYLLCEKYYTPATKRAMASRDKNVAQTAKKAQAIAKHYDTGQLRQAQFPTELEGTMIITEKLHGTSARTGYVVVEQPQWWITKLLNRLPLVNIKPREAFEHLSGTRNCLVKTGADGEKGKNFRVMAHDMIAPQLSSEETWYYELVGFEDTGGAIMAKHNIGKIGDSKLEKRLKLAAKSESITYHYGCTPDGRLPTEDWDDQNIASWRRGRLRFAIYVYRIVWYGEELSWSDLEHRVKQVRSRMTSAHRPFVNTVPTLRIHHGRLSKESLIATCDELSRDAGLGGVPVREGVCVRVETLDDLGKTHVHKSLKHKGFIFCALEGIRKNDPDYIDAEEIA